MSARDPQSGAVVSLFHPRRQRWSDHFIWSADGLQVLGLTPVGRTTIVALALNRERADPNIPDPGDILLSPCSMGQR